MKRQTLILLGCMAVAVTTGCEETKEAQGPELGAIEQYLNENPEERNDDANDFGSEEDEFAAGDE
ncbi:hypothetical protein LOC67_01455 [Stieleria sp. JC731]|uniref:hypothetical protein n=1 Tax=Pirellulaceae TaxID=2691357 RepID=UPI001E292B3B|nr:hypothetical protein [Stieleria sp. JC731]MCC9599209.1 hypothetical protein [Stieleria sp. JC731]